MASVYLRVTYQVAVHNMPEFERALLDVVLPLTRELEIQTEGIWKTTIGKVGEYLELWIFDSMEDFDQKWNALMTHPRLQETFRVTGPMVHDEQLTLLSSLLDLNRTTPER